MIRQPTRMDPAGAFAPSGGPPTEESRAFFQQRLAGFAKIAFVLSSMFLAFSIALTSSHPYALPWVGLLATLTHLAANLVLLATWIACARGAHPMGRLRAMEVATVFLYCLSMAAPIALTPTANPAVKYSILLAFTSVIIGRAVFMPSTARWTLGVSIACAIPLVAAAWRFDHAPISGATTAEATIQTFWTFLWCTDAVALSTVTSYVIYGLRESVRKALRLGQYTLAEKLGSGGMGEVYKASHALLKRPAAVKLLPPDKVGEPTLRRFEREVQLTAQLTHPNTIAIFDYGHTASGIFYYAMEYLDGVDLERLVRGHGAQSPARTVHVLRQVCGALQEAHELGLIHRDIKPANVILCRRGGLFDVAKVVDFGLVKELDAPEPVDVTDMNTITGTPMYLSPEAITGAAVGPHSDLYALGALGYFLVTGRPPFEGNLIEVCGHHLYTVPARPSERLGRSVPGALEDVLLRCLEKDPARRPASANELAAALQAADVGDWTQKQASGWWRDHGAPTGRAHGAADLPVAPRTMSVSL